MSGRVYVRKFDWDEAKRLHGQGMTIAAIARQLGVTNQAIRNAVIPGEYARALNANSAVQRSGTCVDCGGPCSRNYSQHVRRCRDCERAHRATSVRDTELRCQSCKEWKHDNEFPYSRAKKLEIRRGRHGSCRACLTVARRDYRERHKVPCKGGCGRLVLAPNEVGGSSRRRGTRPTGKCHSCAMREVNARRRKLEEAA